MPGCQAGRNLLNWQSMSRTVKCVKLQRELPALPYMPFDDDLGKRLYNEVSMEGW